MTKSAGYKGEHRTEHDRGEFAFHCCSSGATGTGTIRAGFRRAGQSVCRFPEDRVNPGHGNGRGREKNKGTGGSVWTSRPAPCIHPARTRFLDPCSPASRFPGIGMADNRDLSVRTVKYSLTVARMVEILSDFLPACQMKKRRGGSPFTHPTFRMSKFKNNIFHKKAPLTPVFSSNQPIDWIFWLSCSRQQLPNIPLPF